MSGRAFPGDPESLRPGLPSPENTRLSPRAAGYHPDGRTPPLAGREHSPDDVHCARPDLGVTSHDGHAGGEGPVNAEHHTLHAPGQHREVARRKGLVAPTRHLPAVSRASESAVSLRPEVSLQLGSELSLGLGSEGSWLAAPSVLLSPHRQARAHRRAP